MSYERLTVEDEEKYFRHKKARVADWQVVERLAELEDKLENGLLVELPCKVGDTVYIVGNYDCADGHTEDEKLKHKIYLQCVKIGGDCDRCKYSAPKMEEFKCTHIQISTEGILVCGEKERSFLSDRIFTDKAQAEARLKELQEKKQ